MKEFLEIYEQNKDKIEFFIQESLKNIGDLSHYEKDDFEDIFNVFPSLELVYLVDKNSKTQTSPNYYRRKKDNKGMNKDRTYLISRVQFKDLNMAFSTPYISSATTSSCITVTIKENDKILLLDFKIDVLLERLNLIELNKPFHMATKIFYMLAGFSMISLSTFIILYSLYDFITFVLFKEGIELEVIFKPIIALTLGIAIFDLAKTILEQEVYFKSYSKNSRVETKMITKFLITIIIALSIEALIVVFKIAIDDYHNMINALYLITGISLILIALAVFIHLTKKK